MTTQAIAPVLVVAGPTAVGKSSLAVEVARRVGAEIVSADSRQLYRGLSVGTAKPSEAERGGVPHHLIDVLDVRDRSTAGAFLGYAIKSITDIQERGLPVVVVGGSTLYVHALVEGIADLPPIPRSLETELMRQASDPAGADALFRELAGADPAAADSLDPTKTHRLVRWVGVLRGTGQRPSALWKARQQQPLPAVLIVLDRPREELYGRIEARVDAMLADGLLDEVRQLLELGSEARETLDATIGYRELVSVVEGSRSLDEAVRLIKRNTRRYAKRQLTWYRRYEGAIWLDARETTASTVLEAVAPWPESAE